MDQDSSNPNWSITPFEGLQINSTAISDDGQHLLTGTSAEYDTSSNFAVYHYTTDGTSPSLQWSDPLGENIEQGVFWVSVSGDGAYGAAGGEYGSGKGFLRTYNLSQGTSSKQEFSYTSRINEVEMSADGSVMVAVESANFQFFTRTGKNYEQAATESITGAYLRSCAITPDGKYVIAAGEVYPDNSEASSKRQLTASSNPTGILYLYENLNGSLNYLGHYESTNGILRVVITRDGEYFAVSTTEGEVLLFGNPITKQDKLFPLWIYTNSDYSLGLSYALAISHTAAGDLYIASGGNYVGGEEEDTTAYGYAYMLKNTINTYNQNIPERQWIYKLTYCPNPGMNMDENATYLTATDGQPIFGDNEDSSPPSETPGNFYLFNAQNGELFWQYTTSLMNWPMVITPSGSSILSGSDNGTLYYWSPLTSS